MKKNKKQNRRGSYRIPGLDIPATIYTPSGSKYETRIKDISRSGMKITLQHDFLGENCPVVLEFKLPSESKPVSLACSMVYEKDHKAGLNIDAFVQDTSSSRELFDNILKKLAS